MKLQAHLELSDFDLIFFESLIRQLLFELEK